MIPPLHMRNWRCLGIIRFCSVILSLLILSCTSNSDNQEGEAQPDDQQNQKAKQVEQHSSEPQGAEQVDADPVSDVPANGREQYPILGSGNAVDFLRNYFEEHPERIISLSTRYGNLSIQLYEDTPLHTANFLMMIKRGYFSGTEFTRVVENFVVQGGNSEREEDEIKRMLIGNYLIPSEIRDRHIHRKGALAMARSYTDNPKKLSSAYDFYFVVGQVFNEPQLLALEREHEMSIPTWKREVYTSVGGAPHLDGQHTVFGQVIKGMDVLEKMSKTPVDEGNWPLERLIMQLEVVE